MEIRKISGRIVNAYGRPVFAAKVELWLKRFLHKDVNIASTSTTTGGEFGLEYTTEALSPDIYVRVTSEDGKLSVLSPVVLGATLDEVLDLVLDAEAYRGPSELERIEAAALPSLQEEGLGTSEIANFTDEDLTLLAARSGLQPPDLFLLRQCLGLEKESGVSYAAFFGFARQKVPVAGLLSVLVVTPERRRQALEDALQANQIPASTDITAALARLTDTSVQTALTAPLAGTTALGGFLSLAGLSSVRQNALLNHYSTFAAPERTQDFWASVASNNVLAAAEVTSAQNALLLASITHNHLPLVKLLYADNKSTLESIASIPRSQWKAMIEQRVIDGLTVGLPAELEAAGVTTSEYADLVYKTIEDVVPTAMVKANLGSLPGGTQLTTFFATHADYDIRSKPIAAYAKEKGGVVEADVKTLKQYERTFRISPPGRRLESMQILLGRGLDSSQKIRARGRSAFLAEISPLLGKADAELVFERAGLASSIAAALIARHSSKFAGADMAVLPARPEGLSSFPNWEELFGSLDSCSCNECQSVHSPAAYLVDVLHWLEGQKLADGSSVLGKLEGRRPDLTSIELSCKNANTTLPYIDLVLEALEVAVAKPQKVPTYQTIGSAAELRAHPEHVLDEAYEILAADGTVFPLHLPFDLPQEETRVYLGQLGLKRHAIMESLRGEENSDPWDEATARERLGFSEREWKIVTVPSPIGELEARWGVPTSSLSKVATFLRQARAAGSDAMEYGDLTELLRASFVQATPSKISIQFPGGSCDTAGADIVGLDADNLDRINRFLRVQRRLGWSIADLDLAISVLGQGLLGPACLVQIAMVVKLADQLSIPVAQVLAWCGDLDTRRWNGRWISSSLPDRTDWSFRGQLAQPLPTDASDESFFDSIFQAGRTVDKGYDPLFAVKPDGTTLEQERTSFDNARNAVATALRLPVEDLEALLGLWPSGEPLELTLKALSWFYRHVSIARALGIEVKELVSFVRTAGLAAFEEGNFGATVRFVEEAKKARSSAMTIAELRYLFRHEEAEPGAVGPRAEPIDNFAREVGAGLRTQGLGDASSRFEWLAQRVSAEFALPAAIARVAIDQPLPGKPSVSVAGALLELESFDAAPGAEAPGTARDAYLCLHKIALIASRLAARADEAAWLCKYAAECGGIRFEELPVKQLESDADSAANYERWRFLRDAYAVRDRLMAGRFLDLWIRAFEDGSPEDLTAEMVVRAGWSEADRKRAFDLFSIKEPKEWRPATLLRAGAAIALARRAGVSLDTLSGWAEIQSDFAARMTIARQVKDAARAQYERSEWLEIAGKLRDQLREKQRDALVGWLVGNDPQALFQDGPSAVFDRLLLDVEMSACQLTSRIKQAIGSVQLFVQRVLLNLESGVKLDEDAASEWEWMRNYRVWEANRKVFLYPENYLEPELRDDKTPFFKELENTLQQAEITPENVERAVAGYLEKLEEVANLEVVAAYDEFSDGRENLHVIARTPAVPHRYFYRRREDGTSWTAWEKVGVDIDAEHLVPIIFNRRLQLFWPVFTELVDDTQVPDVPTGEAPTPSPGNEVPESTEGSPPPTKYFQIGLAWSEYRDGKWTPKRLAPVRIGKDLDECQRNPLRKESGSSVSEFWLVADEEVGGDLRIQTFRGNQRLPRFRVSASNRKITVEAAATSQLQVPGIDGFERRGQIYTGENAKMLSVPVNGPHDRLNLLQALPNSLDVVPFRPDRKPGEHPFFIRDAKRTLLVDPIRRTPWVRRAHPWTLPSNMSLEVLRNIRTQYIDPKVDRIWEKVFVHPQDMVSRIVQDKLMVSAARTSSQPKGVFGNVLQNVYELGTDIRAFHGYEVARRSNKFVANASVSYQYGSGASVAKAFGINALEQKSLLGEYVLGGGSKVSPAWNTVTASVQTQIDPLPDQEHWLKPLIRIGEVERFVFRPFYHPYVLDVAKQLNRYGIAGIFVPARGEQPGLVRQSGSGTFFDQYDPTSFVAKPHPQDEYDFDGGAYSIYNWELFFHVPMLVATLLFRERRFEDARRWFHYIFDPTDSTNGLSAPQRYWKVKPFVELYNGEEAERGPIQELLLLLHDTSSDPARLEARDRLVKQIDCWRDDPFDPHAIARLRLAAYQKSVVMRYIDNLIEWGDDLFRRDTLESINEATLLYILAAKLLGRRPRQVDSAPSTVKTYADLRDLDEFSNAAMEEVEAFAPEWSGVKMRRGQPQLPLAGPTLFFCVPQNEQLVRGYWDRVADRLFKIRHCMNIDGVVRQLALFEPPIDPALLVRAAALGLDISTVVEGSSAPIPNQRFSLLAQKATELTGDVRSLGASLLAALEKKDAESLQLLRASQEVSLQRSVRRVREEQIDEAKAALESLRHSRENAQQRLQYYRGRPFMNASERRQERRLSEAMVLTTVAQGLDLASAVVAVFPAVTAGIAGWGGSPHITTETSGVNYFHAASATAASVRTAAAIQSHEAQMASLLAGYERRADDWKFQADSAQKDLESLDKQIVAAEIRLAIAEKELENFELQLEHSQDTETFLRDKYTNEQLYQWMVGQLSSLYYKSYQLAFDMARRAEKAMNHELGLDGTVHYIDAGHWDGMKKGLLAGEHLHHDLKRMEAEYLEQQSREYELTRHVSLRTLDPAALEQFRNTGSCSFRIPEAWYDLASPGHYRRRIKTVALSIPAVTGPYAPVHCKLTLESSEYRKNSEGTSYPRTVDTDPRFVRFGMDAIESVVTSRAQEDSGLFEVSLRDERFLPFEGKGAIGTWRLELPATYPSFDYATISDVVLHMRYTAKDGGDDFRQRVESSIAEQIRDQIAKSQTDGGLLVAWNVSRDFPDVWHDWKTADAAEVPSLLLSANESALPFPLRGISWQAVGAEVFMATAEDLGTLPKVRLTTPAGATVTAGESGTPPHFSVTIPPGTAMSGTWSIAPLKTDAGGQLVPVDRTQVDELVVVLRIKPA